jgi:hypothetical protein
VLNRLTDLVAQLSVAAERRGAWEQADALAAVLGVLSADYPDDPASGTDTGGALRELAEVFGLDEMDAGLLLCACAPDLDANIGLAYGHLRGLPGTVGASVGLALELCGLGAGSAAAFERLGPRGPLRRHRLLEVTGTDPWPARALQPAEPVVATLAGATPSDPVVTPMLCAPPALTLPGGDQIVRALEQGAPLIWVRAEPRAAGGSLAAGALQSLGLAWLAVDARRIPHGTEAAVAMAGAARLAGLLGRALIVLGGEVLGGEARGAGADGDAAAAFTALADAPVPVIVTGRCAWNATWLARTPLLLDAAPLSVAERETLWRAGPLGELVEDDAELRQTLLALRMSPDEVAQTGRYAQLLAAAHDEPVTPGIVRTAVRRIGGAHGTRGDRVDGAPGGAPTFDDLVLPEHVLASLHRLVSWGRHRDEVHAHGPLQRGRGIAALFAGNPGTGKTLAAHVIAAELSVELYQVELSAIVDKYIGETEKHLEQVFEAAEAMDVVLFFDEADALFGSRSEVHDARDRYANQEIAYLLQRMERFEGITILATNLRGNLDRAFSRRMSFIVNFPDPDAPIRRQLWEHHLAQLAGLDPADPVDVDYLAEEAELAGGDIRNIVLAAAYDAVGAGEPVGMRHVVAATLQEYRKLGRVLPEHGFVPA